MNKVYIVRSYDKIWGVYATEKAAEEARKIAQRNAEMSGSHAYYGVEEYKVENKA